MVNMHNRQLVFSKVPENGLGDGVLPVGPLNSLTMLTDYIKPEERAVATPNQDVVYGFGLLSLEKEPVVFQVPHLATASGFTNLATSAPTPSVGWESCTAAGPASTWSSVPIGRARCRRESKACTARRPICPYIIPRAFLDDTKEDRAAIQPIISQIMSYPLSEFDAG